MATAVIGATGRVGSEIVRGLLARGDAVVALVRDLHDGHLSPDHRPSPRSLAEFLHDYRAAFV